MKEQSLPDNYIFPIDKEKMEAIIKATCLHYQITESEMMNGSGFSEATEIRRHCLYLISTNTHIKPRKIAARFNKSRQVVLKACSINRPAERNLRTNKGHFANNRGYGNTFEKTSEWQIQ